MKKLLIFLLVSMTVVVSKAQDIQIELWGENQPIVFQSHNEGDAGSYGKMISDLQLEFWEGDNGGIDMRQTYDVSYTNGRSRSGSYIYHGKRDGNKIIFDSYEDGDSMEGTEELTKIDKSFQPYEAVINSPTSITWDKCAYKKMVFDMANGKWISAK